MNTDKNSQKENINNANENSGSSTNKNKTGIFIRYFRKIKKTVDTEYELTEKRYNTVSTKLKHLFRIFTVSGKKFFEDDCLTKSSAIAYTTLISLIPTLTVALTFYSIVNKVGKQKEEIFLMIQKYLAEHNLHRLNISPVLDVISSLIDNAASIGGIGIIVLIFSATAILRSLENSLNSIWKIRKQRPMYLKLIIYWATLTLGPVLLIAGTTLTNKFSDAISKPNYKAVNSENTGRIWIAGSKSDIQYIEKSEVSGHNGILNNIIHPLTENEIDFDNQTVYDYSSDGTFVKTDGSVEKINFQSNIYTDIEFIGNSGWITGEKGIILKTDNSGKYWKIVKLDYFDFIGIEMIDENNGFAAAASGDLFRTHDGGLSWDSVKSWTEKLRFTCIQVTGSSIYISGENGYFMRSHDLGLTWKIIQLDEARLKKTYSNINSVEMFDERYGLIVGNDGLILLTENGGISWKQLKYKNYNYYSISHGDRNNIFVGGEKGTLLELGANRNSWTYSNMKTQNINNLVFSGNRLWSVGDSGMIMYREKDTWLGTKGTSFIMYLLNFMAPFLVIGFSFLLMYYALPNINVPLGAAAIGASVTGSVWVAFTMMFNYYIKILANTTFAIYGALAAIPIFLLVVYASAVIILFGAEITYTLMYPETYKKSGKSRKNTGDMRIINGVRIMHAIYKNFESGKGPTSFTDVNKICNEKITEADYFLEIFKSMNFIAQTENSQYIPANSSRNVKIRDIIDSIHDPNLDLYSTSSDIVRKKLADKFRQMNESRAKILGDETLGDLIDAK